MSVLNKFLDAATRDFIALVAGEACQERFWHYVNKTEDCWLFRNVSEKGYGIYSLNGITFQAHRVSLIWAKKEIQPTMFACHKCRNKNCVRPDHLEFGSAKKNHEDRIRDGTQLSGESHQSARITEDQVGEIVRLLKETNLSSTSIGEQVGCSRSTVKNIGSGKSWLSITGGRVERGLKGIAKNFGAMGHHNAVLNAEKVTEIRKMLKNGHSGRHIGALFNIHPVTVSAIKNGHLWRHVPGGPDMPNARAYRKRLSDKEILEIRQAILRDGSQKYGMSVALAKKYGVSKNVISAIVRGKTKPHVRPEA